MGPCLRAGDRHGPVLDGTRAFRERKGQRSCLPLLSSKSSQRQASEGTEGSLTLTIRAKYSPPRKFSVFKYRSRSSLAPTGLYLELNLSKRWKVCRPCERETPTSSTTCLCGYQLFLQAIARRPHWKRSHPHLCFSLSLPFFEIESHTM